MTIPDRCHRLQIVGTLSGGESMVHSFWLRKAPGGTALAGQAVADDAAAAWNTFLNGTYATVAIKPLFGTTTTYTKAVVYEMDQASGRASNVWESVIPNTAVGSGSQVLPTEVALAATLLTGAPGRSKRGRVYLGGFSTSLMVSATGRANPPGCLAIATGLAAFLNALKTNPGDTTPEGVMTPVVASLTYGTSLAVSAVQVGDVFDAQRRRRNKLTEVRSLAAV